ncbi:peptidase inhibitor family I36 protein [Streptomyces sp. NPDC090108]|uniref:peptidase inhibitor family I36 protein n=1 Tax=Streptomyces sp. NPDC090108 TaxID=3365947 RepID=UPI003806C05B
MKMKMWSKAAVAGAAMTAAALAFATPASASSPKNGSCEIIEVCYYYNSDYAGSMIDYEGDEYSHHDDHFISSGAGQGQVVGNNAASVYCNDGPLFSCTTYFNSGYAGDSYTILGGKRANLPAWLKNNNASSSLWYSGGCSGPGC